MHALKELIWGILVIPFLLFARLLKSWQLQKSRISHSLATAGVRPPAPGIAAFAAVTVEAQIQNREERRGEERKITKGKDPRKRGKEGLWKQKGEQVGRRQQTWAQLTTISAAHSGVWIHFRYRETTFLDLSSFWDVTLDFSTEEVDLSLLWTWT